MTDPEAATGRATVDQVDRVAQAVDCVQPAAPLGAGWQRYVFPAIWLIYLAQTADGVHKHSSGAAAVVGYVIIGLFGITYLVALPAGWHGMRQRFWALYGVAIALTVVESFFAHQDAFVFAVYLGVLTMAFRNRARFAGVGALAIIVTVLPQPLGWANKPDWSAGFSVVLVAFAMYGFFHIIRANRELSAARAEVARLAAENERSRIARDLHDLLGHSLTTITVKAGLARRLAERGDDRSLTEIREVEQLARRTLGDVRSAVAGHREVTLTGELATSREVLRAAGIVAELPGSVDVVRPELHEVFGWVVREGVTNIVRHAHAPTCTVLLGPRWIEISDTGPGGVVNGCGSGLRGLSERLEAVGGGISVTSGFSGFTLRAEVPEPAARPPEPGVVDEQARADEAVRT